MTALDTDVVGRFLVNDDDQQAQRARALIAAGNVHIPPTVLLEPEWVLRSAYGFGAGDILIFFRALLGLPGVSVGASVQVADALKGYEQGLDFADALHLAFSVDAETFATFDTQLLRRTRRMHGMIKVVAA